MSKLRKLRKATGLTMKQVGDKVGKTESCICQYEKGLRNPPVSVAKRLAPVLGCDWEDLYEDDDDGNDLDIKGDRRAV